MTASAPFEHTNDDGRRTEQSFLASHRALAVCTRELARLADEVVLGATALLAGGIEDKPESRIAPGRCIVQLGPVAVTLTWLRSTLDSAADGELLVIVWDGAVAARHGSLAARREAKTVQLPAVARWEEVLVAVGRDEASWRWRSASAATSYSSHELAALAVEQLRLAHADSVRVTRSAGESPSITSEMSA